MFRKQKQEELTFEEALSDDWSKDLEVAEAPLGGRVLFYSGVAVFLIGFLVAGRVLFLGLVHGKFYQARAEANLNQIQKLSAPRGMITDSYGEVLAEDKPVFFAVLQVKEFLREPKFQRETLKAVQDILGIPKEEVWEKAQAASENLVGQSIILSSGLEQRELIEIESLNLPTLTVAAGFERIYYAGPIFSSVIGYTGLVIASDLRRYPELDGSDFVGKSGVEYFYDEYLRGKPGRIVRVRDAKGNILEEREEQESTVGQSLKLTIDAGFQRYFYKRLTQGLRILGRNVGVGLAMNPQSGEILALVNLPSFDNNTFVSGISEERKILLNSPDQPLFNRAISGLYAPGSTIKPLVAVAALEEKVIDPRRNIFSPGYLDIPNPYNPDKPTRFLDWRRQGYVDFQAAIAQSSNVYFYIVGGGVPADFPDTAVRDIKGLGIRRLKNWWEKFRLGVPTGVDLPGEAHGFLPSPSYKEERTGKPWLLGDTYNVSIGQGDLLVTPIQLLTYISAIANGGKFYQSYVADFNQKEAIQDISDLKSSIKEVQKGMVQAVESSKGTARSLADLPFSAAAKTGSAQVRENTRENAFFVGYAFSDDPQIAVLVLVEDAREGSLNALPIARDVLNWYYENRLQ